MRCAIDNGQLKVWLPLTTSTGKVRVKRPMHKLISEPVATRQKEMKITDYLEWQIGYDTDNPDKDNSVLKKLPIERNNKIKYPFELSWMLQKGRQLKLFNDESIQNMKNCLFSSQNNFIEEIDRISISENLDIDSFAKGLGFSKSSVITPLYKKQSQGYFIEITISKKQKAVGFQAMVYLGILLENCLSENDGMSPVGRCALSKEHIYYCINSSLIEDCVSAFSIASRKHREDLQHIFKSLKL